MVEVLAASLGAEDTEVKVAVRPEFMDLPIRMLKRPMRSSRVLFQYVLLRLVLCLILDPLTPMYLRCSPHVWV